MAFGTRALNSASRTVASTVRTVVRAATRQPVLALLVLAAVVALVYVFRREGFKKCKDAKKKYYDTEQGKCMRKSWCTDKGGKINGNMCEGRSGGNCKKPKVWDKDAEACVIPPGAKDSKASGKDCNPGSYWDSDKVRCMKKSSCKGKFVDYGKEPRFPGDTDGITRGICISDDEQGRMKCSMTEEYDGQKCVPKNDVAQTPKCPPRQKWDPNFMNSGQGACVCQSGYKDVAKADGTYDCVCPEGTTWSPLRPGSKIKICKKNA